MEPYYDPTTDRIYNATPGTWAYNHELRHRWQFKKIPKLLDATTKVHIRGYYASIIASIILVITFGWTGIVIGIGLGMLPHVLLTALLELDAYVMGTYQHLKELYRKRYA